MKKFAAILMSKVSGSYVTVMTESEVEYLL